jgi:hypothetical protein
MSRIFMKNSAKKGHVNSGSFGVGDIVVKVGKLCSHNLNSA